MFNTLNVFNFPLSLIFSKKKFIKIYMRFSLFCFSPNENVPASTESKTPAQNEMVQKPKMNVVVY